MLAEGTENSKTMRFQKIISEIQFLSQFLKIVPSENFPLYGTIYFIPTGGSVSSNTNIIIRTYKCRQPVHNVIAYSFARIEMLRITIN